MIRSKIESVMRDKGINTMFSFENFLYILSLCFSDITRIRAFLFKKNILRSKQLPCKVISIGNIAVGGTGKTPMTIYVAELLQDLGYKPVVISRGYKGGAEKSGGVVSDGKKMLMGYDMAGDEAFMMASKLNGIPLFVGGNRYKSSMMAVEKFNPDVIVLDDAFQHLKLSRDIDLVLLDYNQPFGNGHLLPRGILREPVSALLRSDAFIFTRAEDYDAHEARILPKNCQNKPIFTTTHTPYISYPVSDNKAGCPERQNILKDRKIYIFSGIARNSDFQNTVRNMGGCVVGYREFSDHHKFTDKELESICRAAQDAHADMIATTEKNYFGIADRISWPIEIVVIGINITFTDKNGFYDFIRARLQC